MLNRIAKAVVTWLAVSSSLISGLSSESAFGREVSESSQKFGALIEDPDFLMATIAESTASLTASDYQTLVDEGQTDIDGSPLNNKRSKSFQETLKIFMDISLNPDLKKISQIFTLNQLAMPFKTISFDEVFSKDGLEGESSCAPLRDERYPTTNRVTIYTRDRQYPNVKATFIHEVTHITIQRLYENEANPYPSTPKERKDKYENAFELVSKNLEELAHDQASFTDVEKYFYKRWYESLKHYSAQNYHIETIVLLPELLAYFDIEVKDLPQRLQTALKPYLEYWDSVNQDISAYVTRMQDILDITDIEGTFSEEMLLNADLVQKENLYALIKQGTYSREDFKGFRSDRLAALNKKGTIQALLENQLCLEDIKESTRKMLNVLNQEDTQEALLEGRFNIEDFKNPGSEKTKTFKTEIEELKGEDPVSKKPGYN